MTRNFPEGHRVLVAGASSGMGASVARLLGSLGATVVGIGRDAARLEEVRAGSATPADFFVETKDLAEDVGALPGYIESLAAKYGRFGGMVFSAGEVELAPVSLLDCAEMRRLFEIDCFAPLFAAKGFVSPRCNAGRGSAAVFISSSAAVAPSAGMAAYSGAKAALCAMAKSLARETAKDGIRINCILPSVTDTPMARRAGFIGPEGASAARYPFGPNNPDTVAELAAFLLSDAAKTISGQDYIVDSGFGSR